MIRWEKVEAKNAMIGKEGGNRWRHTCNSINGGRHLYVFGGNDKYNRETNQVHVFDTVNQTWSQPAIKGTPPIPRDGHTCSVIGHRLFVFGGSYGLNELNDLHILDTYTLIWRELSTSGQLLPPRNDHSTVSFGKNLFVFGGWTDGTDLCNDIYMLDIDTGIWTNVTNTTNCPSARYCVAGDCLDPLKGVFVFMGGCNVNDEGLDDMYYLYTEGIARESEERPEKLSIKKQLNLKCQEELNLFSSQNHTTAVPLDPSNMVDNHSDVEFDVEEFRNKLKQNPLAVLDGIIVSFSTSKDSIVPLLQGSETSKSSKMTVDSLIHELHSIAFERDLLEISKMSSFLRGAIDSFKPKIIAHEKMFTPQQLEHVQGLIHILEALLKADQELEAAKEQKIQADKAVETHLQEVTAARLEIEVQQKKVEEFFSKETEIDNEIVVLRGKIKDFTYLPAELRKIGKLRQKNI